MLKRTLQILLTLLVLQNIQASDLSKDLSEDLFCAYTEAMRIKDDVQKSVQPFARDKYVHCTISCTVGVKCGITSSAILGVAKEIYDLFGPGNAELEDLLADVLGLRISRRASVYNLETCSSACKYYYPF